ncbi:hypothetical protein EZV62_003550 [Acer yangbiense]|uniref:Uncharacterized protein n=1 Tax=Acer yangbiense TaxID=1000413 RepID=A0A5C7IHQ3_9ROSI|nr:hypothetical protein EZV62_003550 [Acer yangbiense]
MSQQLESGNVQPNVNPSFQSSHERGDLQPNVDPFLQPNYHESGGEQSNVNPFLQPNQESGDVQPNVNHSLQPNHESGGQQPNADPSLQPNRESGGEQPEANPSLQPNHENMPCTGISEEPRLSQPQSAGGNAHQPKLSEARGANEITTGERLKYYRPLYLAAHRGDWETAKSFIEKDQNALTADITSRSKTVLHVATLCCQWGFVLKLLERLSPESIEGKSEGGNTVLHYVAQGGCLKTAKALVQKNAGLLQMVNSDGDLPLFVSITSESNKEMVWYLSLITQVTVPPRILRHLILSGCHDIALYYVQKYPNLALAKDGNGNSLLYWLATNPSCFFSGSNLGFFERLIYKFVHVKIKNAPTHLVMVNIEESTDGQPRSLATQVLQLFKRLFWKAIAQLAPSVKTVRDAKLKHKCAVELVTHVCTQLSTMRFQEIVHFLQNPQPILGTAVTCGIEEFVRTLLQHFPEILYYEVLPHRNILQAAIEYRQEKIVNIMKEISQTITKNMCSPKKESETITLHLAGRLAPAFKLFSVSGAASQMQRELQWFKVYCLALEIKAGYSSNYKIIP